MDGLVTESSGNSIGGRLCACSYMYALGMLGLHIQRASLDFSPNGSQCDAADGDISRLARQPVSLKYEVRDCENENPEDEHGRLKILAHFDRRAFEQLLVRFCDRKVNNRRGHIFSLIPAVDVGQGHEYSRKYCQQSRVYCGRTYYAAPQLGP